MTTPKRITDFPAASPIVGNELIEVSQLSTTIKIEAATISAAAADNSFNDSGTGFVAAGFAVGDRVGVSGFATGANNLLIGIVTDLTAGKMTIGGTDGDVIVNEAAGEVVTIAKWTTRRTTADDLGAFGVLPPGGTTGQVLTKQSSTDQDADWETPSGGGGGGSGYLSVQDEIYKSVAEANMTMTHGASGTLYDRVIDKGGFVIMALAGSVRGTTFRAGSTYVVPTGKIAVIVDAKFDVQTLTNPTFYKHRLYNVTTTGIPAGPNGTMAGSTQNDFIGTQGGNPGPWAAVNVDIPYPTPAGVAGDTLRAEIAGGSDSNDRPTSGIYVLAIIDATTHELDPITA